MGDDKRTRRIDGRWGPSTIWAASTTTKVLPRCATKYGCASLIASATPPPMQQHLTTADAVVARENPTLPMRSGGGLILERGRSRDNAAAAVDFAMVICNWRAETSGGGGGVVVRDVTLQIIYRLYNVARIYFICQNFEIRSDATGPH